MTAAPGGPTSQEARTEAEQAAGRDARQVTTTVNLSGSAWAIVALAIVLGLGVMVWARTAGRLREVRSYAHDADECVQLTGRQLGAVAKAIQDLGPGPQRDRLLATIGQLLDPKARVDLDRFLAERGLYVSRQEAA